MYFQANSKKEAQKNNSGSENCNNATLGLYYLGKCLKENKEAVLKALSGLGVDFQEKMHGYHHKIFHAEGFNSETIKKANDSLNGYLNDESLTNQVNNIWTEGKLEHKHETQHHINENNRKEGYNKPQLFAMSSDEEEEEHVNEQPKKYDSKVTKTDEAFKPAFIP